MTFAESQKAVRLDAQLVAELLLGRGCGWRREKARNRLHRLAVRPRPGCQVGQVREAANDPDGNLMMTLTLGFAALAGLRIDRARG